MLVLAMENENIVHVSQAIKGFDYTCPDCGDLVRCRKGEVNAHHYFHLNSECTSNGESVVHRYFKEKFAKLTTINLNGVDYNVTQSFIEKTITPQLRVDVLLILDGWKPIVIEVCYKNKKTDTHREMFAQLGLEAYEVYVGFNEEGTDFEVIGHETLHSSSDLLSKCVELEQQVIYLENELKDYRNVKSEFSKLQVKAEKTENKLKKLERENNSLKQMLDVKEETIIKEKTELYKNGEDYIKNEVEKITGLTYGEFSLSFRHNDLNYYGVDIAYNLDSMIEENNIDSFNLRYESGLSATLIGSSNDKIVKVLKLHNCTQEAMVLIGRIIEKSYGVTVQVQKRNLYTRTTR